MADQKTSSPWVDGTYICQTQKSMFVIVEGENVTLESSMMKKGDENSKGTWTFGDFGETNPAVAEKTGKKTNNVHIHMWKGMMDMKGVLSEDKKTVTFWSGIGNELDAFTWKSQEEIAAFKDSGDPHDAPPSHYKIQPENQGKFIFISGGPGLGKSTTGHLLSKMAGFVYYEADCFMNGSNPYLPPDSKEPTVDAIKQKSLKGIPQERLDAVAGGMKDFLSLIEGEDYDLKPIENFYSAMCKDIVKERKRMGGDWVVAQAVPFRSLRDMMKQQLGPDLVFIVLNMSKEDQEMRVKMRHGEDENAEELTKKMTKMFSVYEPVADDEKNAINVHVTKEMTRQEVAQNIHKLIK